MNFCRKTPPSPPPSHGRQPSGLRPSSIPSQIGAQKTPKIDFPRPIWAQGVCGIDSEFNSASIPHISFPKLVLGRKLWPKTVEGQKYSARRFIFVIFYILVFRYHCQDHQPPGHHPPPSSHPWIFFQYFSIFRMSIFPGHGTHFSIMGITAHNLPFRLAAEPEFAQKFVAKSEICAKIRFEVCAKFVAKFAQNLL